MHVPSAVLGLEVTDSQARALLGVVWILLEELYRLEPISQTFDLLISLAGRIS